MFKTICYENKLFFQRIMGSVKTITTCLDSDGGGQEEERRPKKKKKQFSDFITYDHCKLLIEIIVN